MLFLNLVRCGKRQRSSGKFHCPERNLSCDLISSLSGESGFLTTGPKSIVNRSENMPPSESRAPTQQCSALAGHDVRFLTAAPLLQGAVPQGWRRGPEQRRLQAGEARLGRRLGHEEEVWGLWRRRRRRLGVQGGEEEGGGLWRQRRRGGGQVLEAKGQGRRRRRLGGGGHACTCGWQDQVGDVGPERPEATP